ncbi:MAG: response regulator [Deltaproteobacteria bacterium]|nr:response regulator [Deltaproteobacteria bacterium]MBW2016404.1 response regulator [Deltaproteobacteria bacterium]MBW2130302.1 response regulator [Deltaproteobacteria bacterium]MBW2302336.1 response regulator [Deltaproteobacteria bacterium]
MDILIVEDDAWTASALKSNMEKWNHHVEAINTCKEALNRAEEKRFDLAILDIFLPDGKGHQLIPHLKALNHDIGIVTMTGSNSRELELEVRQEGISFYLIKPLSLKDLKRIVDHMNNRLKKEPKTPSFISSVNNGNIFNDSENERG